MVTLDLSGLAQVTGGYDLLPKEKWCLTCDNVLLILKTKGFPLSKTPLCKTETIFRCLFTLLFRAPRIKCLFFQIRNHSIRRKPGINKFLDKLEPRGNLVVALVVLNVLIHS